jgi:hypothetical protein
VSRLFIELYLDEDVDVLIADMLRGRGFNVITTREALRLGATDTEQLDYAISQERTLLTHNRVHFEALAVQYLAAGRDHSGLLLASRRLPQEIVQRLLVLLNSVTADEIHNQIRYL